MAAKRIGDDLAPADDTLRAEKISDVSAKTPVLRSGSTLGSGRFEVRSRIGAGGMGVVYEAFDCERGQNVALKTLSRLDANGIYGLKQEFRALADVTHPNLVGLHELFAEGDTWFFTMDLVDGRPFDEWLRARGGSESDLRHALRELAEGVSAIHAAGILHRDLKPSNVMVTEDARVIILDFGLASDRRVGGAGQTVDDGGISGTPAYMSPEQARGSPATTASDWYAVGVMMFQGLTGTLPFEGSTLLVKKLSTDAPPPSSINPEVAKDLEELCQELLAQAPGRRPTGADVLARLGPGDSIGRSLSPSASETQGELFGREQELQALHRAHAKMLSGSAAAVLVRGESGMGKSRLIGQFLDELRRGGRSMILSGRCYERESVPYKAFDSVVDELSRHLRKLPRDRSAALMPRDAFAIAKLFPILNRVDVVGEAPRREIPDPQELQQRGFAAFTELLGRIRDRQPLVIHVDDLQWTDRDSTALFAYLVSQARSLPVLFLLSFRSEDASENVMLEEIQTILSTDPLVTAEQISVGPLPPAAAADLTRFLLGRPANGLSARIAEESGGNPLFVQELVRFSIEEGREAFEPSLDEALARRVAELPPAARHLLRLVAFSGRPIPQNLCLRALATRGSASPGVDLLLNQQLLRSTPHGSERTLECFHDRVRESATRTTPAEEALLIHRQLAEVFETAQSPDPESLARHWEEAGEPDRAAGYAAQAAVQAMAQLAFDRASSWSSHALKGTRLSKAERARLFILSGDAHAAAGRGSTAANEYLEAAALVDAAQSLDLHRRAAEQLLMAGHMERGTNLLERVLKTLGMPLANGPLPFLWQRLAVQVRGTDYEERDASQIDALDLARVDASWTCANGFGMSDNIRGATYQAYHLREALRLGEPMRVARALLLEYGFQGRLGAQAHARSERYYEKIQALADRLGDRRLLGLCSATRTQIQFCQGNLSGAVATGREAIEELRGQGGEAPHYSAIANYFRTNAHYLLGDFALLQKVIPELMTDAERRKDVWALVTLAAGWQRSAALLTLDRADESRQLARQLRSRWTTRGHLLQHSFLLLGDVADALYVDESSAAHEAVERSWAAYRASQQWRIPALDAHMLVARAGSAVAAIGSRRNEAGALIALTDRCVADLAKLRSRFAALQCYEALLPASVALAANQPEQARKELARGIELADGTGARMIAAGARLRLGQLLEGDEGRELVEGARKAMAEEGVVDPDRLTKVLVPGPRLPS